MFNKKNKPVSIFNDTNLTKGDASLEKDSTTSNDVPNFANTPITDDVNDQNNSSVDTNSNLSSQDENSNEIFFEKFEKSKKDFLRERKEKTSIAKKSLASQFKQLGLANKLNDKAFLRKNWIAFLSLAVFFLAYFIVVIVFLAPFFNGAGDTSKWTFVNLNLGLGQTAVISSGIAIGFIVVPYVYLMASWFVGINQTYRSVNFFVTNWLFLSIAVLCFLLAVITSSIIFAFVAGFQPIV